MIVLKKEKKKKKRCTVKVLLFRADEYLNWIMMLADIGTDSLGWLLCGSFW